MRGFCAVSACALLSRLQIDFPDERLVVAAGQVVASPFATYGVNTLMSRRIYGLDTEAMDKEYTDAYHQATQIHDEPFKIIIDDHVYVSRHAKNLKDMAVIGIAESQTSNVAHIEIKPDKPYLPPIVLPSLLPHTVVATRAELRAAGIIYETNIENSLDDWLAAGESTRLPERVNIALGRLAILEQSGSPLYWSAPHSCPAC